MREAFRRTVFKRKAFFLIADIILIILSIYASFWLRFDGQIPAYFASYLWLYFLMALAIKTGFLAYHGLYAISWRFFSLLELLNLLRAMTLSSLTMGLLLFLLKTYPPFTKFPRSILLLDFIISGALIAALRISKRAVREYSVGTERRSKGKTRILIIGAGAAGEQIIREMLTGEKSRYFPVGCIDDDPAKKGITLHGVKILGSRYDIPQVLRTHPVDEVLVAIPSGSSREIRKIVEIIRESAGVKTIKILPGITDIIDGKVTLADIQEIKIEDLLGREPVAIDFEIIRKFLSGKRILITGAGGSIGSELVKKVLQFRPQSVGLLDIDETALFLLLHRLKPASSEIVPIVGDITDQKRMASVFADIRPEIVLHAAAYKHVPMLEYMPEAAVKTNVLGTRILAELALKTGVTKFVYISTDKAINPTSVMGSTKRVGEEMLSVLNKKDDTRFVCVRFGNVLGSRGSVIQLFSEQIQRGGPVTVTHPEMKRYFMALSEAVLLVLEAAAVGEGGEVYVLDMGNPIKIVDLAKEMIRLSGYGPDVDIPIVYSGLRPGEKLFEELLGAEEGSEPTPHEKIHRMRKSRLREAAELMAQIDALIKAADNNEGREKIIECLKGIVQTYKPDAGLRLTRQW
ncbi:MAG: polysaccharide biosynthesis protein [Candidatus Aminicenantes bacterium]|nr:polysaccharide biosynthesis protein [Candidatus Aminicenantes bacterium]